MAMEENCCLINAFRFPTAPAQLSVQSLCARSELSFLGTGRTALLATKFSEGHSGRILFAGWFFGRGLQAEVVRLEIHPSPLPQWHGRAG